jgi:hypothetical protein
MTSNVQSGRNAARVVDQGRDEIDPKIAARMLFAQRLGQAARATAHVDQKALGRQAVVLEQGRLDLAAKLPVPADRDGHGFVMRQRAHQRVDHGDIDGLQGARIAVGAGVRRGLAPQPVLQKRHDAHGTPDNALLSRTPEASRPAKASGGGSNCSKLIGAAAWSGQAP